MKLSPKPPKAFSIMRVAFVQNFWEDLSGPLLLAEILVRQGHEVRFFLEERGFEKKIGRFAPEVIALSVCTGQHHWYLDFAEKAKKGLAKKPLVVMGGPHPTHFPEIVKHPAIDAICRGDGEIAFPKFLSGVVKGAPPVNVENFYVKLDGRVHENPIGKVVKNLDELPIPTRKELYDPYPFLRTSPHKKIMASRGCPFNCYYCSNHAFRALARGKGPYLRWRSVDHVMAEISLVKERYGYRFLDISDDLFTLNRKWALDFCARYEKEIGLPYGVNLHARFIDDEIAAALKSSGCNSVAFGVECGNDKTRKELLGKDVTNAEIRRCVEILKRHKIWFRTYNIIGLPGEPLETTLETLRLNQELKPDYAWCTLPLPLPGTRFAEICTEKTGMAEDEAMRRLNKSWFDASVVTGPDAKKIQNLHKFFGILVRRPWLMPLVDLLVKLPPNQFFRMISQAYYGNQMKKRTHMGWLRLFQIYFKVRKQY